ncbi:MAG: hypothetical protein IPM16_12485 [Chloroflexi bacterium]|nr:hypothetical protein [Chloroflexota bacterium]
MSDSAEVRTHANGSPVRQWLAWSMVILAVGLMLRLAPILLNPEPVLVADMIRYDREARAS